MVRRERLSEKDKELLQLRLKQFLKTYRKEMDLSAKQLAEIMGWTEIHQRRFESSSPENRVITGLDILKGFGSLKGMSVTRFVDFLSKSEPSEGLSPKQDDSWETKLIRAVENCGVKLRMELLNIMLEDEDGTHLEQSLSLGIKLHKAFKNKNPHKAEIFVESLYNLFDDECVPSVSSNRDSEFLDA